MGDPKKLKKKYSTPNHPWIRAAIESEKVLVQEFGLVKKKEILIASSFLRKYKKIAKNLIATKTQQAQREKELVLAKLKRLGILPSTGTLDQILTLEVKDVLNRRMQSVVYRKGLARSMKQARQFITHRHVRIADKEVTSPSYLVPLEEEEAIAFHEKSVFINVDHPERIVATKPKDDSKKDKKNKGNDEEDVIIPEENVE
ncbi:30S ribosomal protein S4 [Candidatus Woesearchaeota archaeon]|nr:30S ribosomal protein S4 [Candidatus Woesearchaeota archaeon]